MPSLPDDYLSALMLLGRACVRYQARTGSRVVIVGGAAASFYTQGAILTGDFDMVTDNAFEVELLAEGFIKEDRVGQLLIGYYHPDMPRLGFQFVSGRLFDGRADDTRLLRVRLNDDSMVIFPPAEDLIADRLGQFAASDGRSSQLLEQARLLFNLATDLDERYLIQRSAEESGDPSLLGL